MRKDNSRKIETPRTRKNGSVKPKIKNSEKKNERGKVGETGGKENKKLGKKENVHTRKES